LLAAIYSWIDGSHNVGDINRSSFRLRSLADGAAWLNTIVFAMQHQAVERSFTDRGHNNMPVIRYAGDPMRDALAASTSSR